MKHLRLMTLFACALVASACGAPVVALSTRAISSAPSTDPPGVLMFDIGMHIEPFGATPSKIVAGNVLTRSSNSQGGDFNTPQFFRRHVQDIQTVAAMVEKHRGRMTIQAQSPFTTEAIKLNDPILADLEARGHEIALHFHEEAHLGKSGNMLTAETWCAVMKEEIGYIHQAGAKDPLRFWSGGNLYPNLLQAGACAGLDVNSDWKNPQTQSADPALIGIHPWRPAGGAKGSDVSAFAQNDPNGKIIYLPDGLFARNDFNSMRRADNSGGDQAYFEFLKQSLQQSLAAAEPNQTNVFHITIHSGEFRGDLQHPFAVIDQFLTQVVDPLVQQSKLKWATFSEMADAYRANGQ